MRIGFIVYALDRSVTGIGTYMRELLASLKILGINVTILQAGRGGMFPDTYRLFGTGLLPGLLTIGQVKIGLSTKQLGLDLIHDPTGTAPLYFAHAHRVVTIYDAFPYVQPETSTLLDLLIYKYWLPQILTSIDHIITISQQSKQDIVKYLPIEEKNVTITPLAINSNFKVLTPEEIDSTLINHVFEKPYILYVGSIHPRKNLFRLLEAYASMRDYSLKWHLVIVGAQKFWKSTPIVAIIEKLGLQDCVHFTGYVPEEDLPSIYNCADLFVFPSLYEGFGLPILEAMACGTPVVTSNISSLPEVAGDAALLVDPYDVEAIAHAMFLVLSDPDLAADLRQRGLERAKQFTWEKTAHETIKVYERVLGREI